MVFFLQISLLRKDFFFITLSTKIFQSNKPDFYIFIYKISKFNPILLIKKLLIGKWIFANVWIPFLFTKNDILFDFIKKRSHWIVLLTFKRKFKFVVCRLEFIKKKRVYPILRFFKFYSQKVFQSYFYYLFTFSKRNLCKFDIKWEFYFNYERKKMFTTLSKKKEFPLTFTT